MSFGVYVNDHGYRDRLIYFIHHRERSIDRNAFQKERVVQMVKRVVQMVKWVVQWVVRALVPMFPKLYHRPPGHHCTPGQKTRQQEEAEEA
jgi:hypothetical protein